MKKAVAIGTFDGLHLGHQAVLNTLISESEKRKLLPYIYTFSNIPAEFLKNENHIRIMSLKEKLNELNRLGFYDIIIKTFDDEYSKISQEQFVYELRELDFSLCVVGSSFTFGALGSGTPDSLTKLCKKFGMETIILPRIEQDGKAVTSSRIRSLIASGDIINANKLLTRPYTVSGEVVHGKGLGKKLGIPSANQICINEKLYPKNGVYATQVNLDGKEYRCVTNVGVQPTVEGGKKAVETHIIGFSGDLYNKELKVEFLRFLRPERKFSSTDLLIKTIKRDIIAASDIGVFF